jgi:hypothetical protein
MTKPQVTVFMMLSLITACATAAQRQYQTIVQSHTAAAVEVKNCVQAVANSPQFAPLRAHVPVDPRDATLDQMTNTATVTPEKEGDRGLTPTD